MILSVRIMGGGGIGISSSLPGSVQCSLATDNELVSILKLFMCSVLFGLPYQHLCFIYSHPTFDASCYVLAEAKRLGAYFLLPVDLEVQEKPQNVLLLLN